MNSDPTAILVAVAALLTGAAAIWQQRRGSRTDESSIAGQLTDAARAMITDLRVEIDRLHGTVQAMRTENTMLQTSVANLQHLVAALESEVVTLGGDPKRIRLEVAERRRKTDQIDGTPI